MDVLWCLFGPQRPRDLAPVAELVIRCRERDVALALELSSDLAIQLSGDIENWTRGDTKTGPPWSFRCSTG